MTRARALAQRRIAAVEVFPPVPAALARRAGARARAGRWCKRRPRRAAAFPSAMARARSRRFPGAACAGRSTSIRSGLRDALLARRWRRLTRRSPAMASPTGYDSRDRELARRPATPVRGSVAARRARAIPMTDLRTRIEALARAGRLPRVAPEPRRAGRSSSSARSRRSTATSRRTSRCSSPRRSRRNPREVAQALVDALAARPAWSSAPKSPAPASSTSSSRRRRARRWCRASSPSATPSAGSERARGERVHGRVRLGQSDRAAARRPRPPGRARRRARATCSQSQGARRHARVLLQRRRRADREPRACRCARARRSRRASRDVARGRLQRRVHRASIAQRLPRRESAHGDRRRHRRRSASSRSPTCATSRTSTCRRSACSFDNYYLEISLYTDGRVEATVDAARSPPARPTSRTARCGCAPPTTATTRTA